MNRTDSKRVLAIFVGLLSALCVETCRENQFQLPDSVCCPKCPEGMYVTQNCSEVHGKSHIGVDCNKCRRCEDGQITVSNCTLFSDTQCDMGPISPTEHLPPFDGPISPTEHLPPFDGQLSQITLFGWSVVVFMLAVFLAVGLFIRIRKSGGFFILQEKQLKGAETV